jgi:iron complex outermembrane receptor protein
MNASSGRLNGRRCTFIEAAVAAMSGGALALLCSQPTAAQEEDVTRIQNALAEVIVTAQFRERRLQETPLAITALRAEALERRNMTNITDVGKVAPNMVLQPSGTYGGKSAFAYIRGVGQYDVSFALEPGVAMYIDDVYHSGLFGTVFDLLDVDRVEVMRGPQGTLFGKNSIGGAVRLVSRKPQGDGTGFLEVTGGNYDRRDIRGAFDLALLDRVLFLRVAGASKQRAGHVDQLDFGCVHSDLGGIENPNAPLLSLLRTRRTGTDDCRIGTFGGEDVQAARAALRWLPNEAMEASFVADWMNDHSEAGAETLIAVNSDSADPTNLLHNPFGGFNANVAIPIYGVPYDNRFVPASIYQSYANFDNVVHSGASDAFPTASVTGTTAEPDADGIEAFGLSMTVGWQLARAVQLKSITAYRSHSGVFSEDLDGSPIGGVAITSRLNHRQFSQELRLLGTLPNGRLEWAAGLFYFKGSNRLRGSVNLGILTWLVPDQDWGVNETSSSQDTAAFTHGIWHLTRRLDVTAGVRYTKERKDYTFSHFSFLPALPPSVPPTRKEVRYGKSSPLLALDFQWTPEVMSYVSVSTGFRAGGFNPRPFNSSQVTLFGPEKLTTYEVGLKSEWLEQRLRLNLALFSGRYEDLQVGVFSFDETGVPFNMPLNVGRARIDGGEIELSAQPVHNLLLSAAFGLQRTTYLELGAAIDCAGFANPMPTPAPDANCTIGGTPRGHFVGLPERTGSLAIQYAIRLQNGSSVTPDFAASYQSAGFSDNAHSAVGKINPRTLLDGRITWESGERDWSVALSGTNLTNRPYVLNKANALIGFGMATALPGRPREWAVTVKHSFRR